MGSTIAFASVAITAALVLYTAGVFGERRHHYLGKAQLALFWAGLACDSTGTALMGSYARTNGISGLDVHAVTGAAAIALMLAHAVWASLVVWRGSERARQGFSRYSVAVWLAWLVPYLVGLLMGIPALGMTGTKAGVASVAIVAAIALVLHLRQEPTTHEDADGTRRQA